MAKRQSKKGGFPIPKEEAEKILHMDPKLLGNEIARTELHIQTQKEENKKDEELQKLQGIADALEADIVDKDPEVQKLKNQLEDLKQQIKDSISSAELDQAKADVKHWRKGLNGPLNKDKKKLKFMIKTFQSHLHSGAIKLQN